MAETVLVIDDDAMVLVDTVRNCIVERERM